MAKDYAKKNNAGKKKGASRSKKKNPAPKGLIFIAFLMLSGLVALLVYLQWYQKPQTTQTNQTHSTKKTDTNVSNKAIDDKISTQDDEVPFYQIHEEMVNKTVDIPADDLKLPEDEHQYSYLMPCGSFRDIKRAQQLEAQIAFSGYESKINQVKVKSGVWHRVELGPFTSKRKAESIRHRLQDNGFINCKIWPKKIN